MLALLFFVYLFCLLEDYKGYYLLVHLNLPVVIARLSTRNLDLIFVDDVFGKLSSMEREKTIKMLKALIKSQSTSALIMTDDDSVAKAFGYNKKYLVYGSLSDTPDVEIK